MSIPCEENFILDRPAFEPDKETTYHFVVPLIKAASANFPDVARVLLKHGADMDAVDRLDRTAWMYASMAGREEIAALLNPYHDVQRLGIDFVASPRHADLLLVTGIMTRNLEEAALRTYEAMPEPRLVVAVGACAISGGVFAGSPFS